MTVMMNRNHIFDILKFNPVAAAKALFYKRAMAKAIYFSVS